MDFERTRRPGSTGLMSMPLYSNSNIKPNKYIPDLHLDSIILDLMCKMVVTDSQYIKRSNLLNLKKYIDSIDPKEYDDPEKRKLVSFINKGLEARLMFNINSPELIVRHINGGMLDDGVIDINNFVGLDAAKINWLNTMISSTLKYEYVFGHVDKILDICTRFKTSGYDSKNDIVKEFETSINNAQNDFRRVRNEAHTEATFSLIDGEFEDSIIDSYNQLANPRRKLRTGMQGLNELLGGGFESGRVYIFFGLPGEGKSTTLINLLFQLKKYNNDYKPKDPTKIPTIVLLTMENTIVESIERLFGLSCIRSTGNITDYSVEEVIQLLRTEGELYLDSNSPINILIKYKPTNSVDTSYLYTLCEDLEDRGMEVIAMIQDYIGRIRSTQYYSDTRLEYGAVTDEFKVFAEIKDIPVISASQLNRDASKHIDEGRKNNKADLVRFIGRSNISESMLVLNNIDAGFVIAPEVTEEGEKFLGVQRIKIRYRAGDREYVYLPYIRDSIRFIEDLGREATFKTTMRRECELFTPGNHFRQSQYHTNAIVELEESTTLIDDGDANLFKNANFISNAAYRQKNVDEGYSPIVFFKQPEINSPFIYLNV